MPGTSTTVLFEGLLIFHQDGATDPYEVGILDTSSLVGHHSHFPPHEFKISVLPDPPGGVACLCLGPADLNPFLQQGNRWSLDVEDALGSPTTGIQADPSLPADRKDASSTDMKLGWIVNLESPEFHGPLTRRPGFLKPIIKLTKGELYTHCKTGGVDVLQNCIPSITGFGYLAGVTALKIDTSAQQEVVLKVASTEIFRLPKGSSYQVSITNSNFPPTMESHFHAYYDLLYPQVPVAQRFDFKANHALPSPPNQCPPGPVGIRALIPAPYRCGGTLSAAGGPLN